MGIPYRDQARRDRGVNLGDAPVHQLRAQAGEDTIRERLRQGRLPREAAQLVSAGAGSGLPCAGCGQEILHTDQQWECEVDGCRLQFHQVCYLVWDEERDRTER